MFDMNVDEEKMRKLARAAQSIAIGAKAPRVGIPGAAGFRCRTAICLYQPRNGVATIVQFIQGIQEGQLDETCSSGWLGS